MKYQNLNQEEVEAVLSNLLSKANLSTMVNVDTLKMWFTKLNKIGESHYLSMLSGLWDENLIENPNLINNLFSAVIRYYQTIPSPEIEGRNFDEEMERRKNENEDTTIKTTQKDFPPLDWFENYSKAGNYLRENKIIEAVGKFEACFSKLYEKKTTWREIYRVYCNAGLAYLLNGKEFLGEMCLEIALELNPKYRFAENLLADYNEGKFNSHIMTGFFKNTIRNMKKFTERPDHLKLNNVMKWSEKRILKKLSAFGVEVDKERFIEKSKTAYIPDTIAEELFFPKSKTAGRDKDFIWIATYALWEIYCPDEPSVTNFGDILTSGTELITSNETDLPAQGSRLAKDYSGILDNIENFIFTKKKNFLIEWSKNFDYSCEDHNNITFILNHLGFSPIFEKRVLQILNRLKQQIPHPDWGTIEICIDIRKNDSKWEIKYSELMEENPYFSFSPVMISEVFEKLDDLENTEKYLKKALKIADTRSEDMVETLETSNTTIYDDYQYVLGRLELFYEMSNDKTKKIKDLNTKRREIETKKHIWCNPLELKNQDEKIQEELSEFKAEMAETTPAIQYYEFLKQYMINFETEEKVPVYQASINPGKNEKKSKKRPGKKRKKRNWEKIKKKREKNKLERKKMRRKKSSMLSKTK